MNCKRKYWLVYVEFIKKIHLEYGRRSLRGTKNHSKFNIINNSLFSDKKRCIYAKYDVNNDAIYNLETKPNKTTKSVNF